MSEKDDQETVYEELSGEAGRSSEEVDEVSNGQKVTLAFAEAKDSIFVALKGT